MAGIVPCFSSKTLVRTLESPVPIAMEDLKTGDHVQCMDTNEDMRLPTTAKYCEVMAWLHARQDASVNTQRIHFRRPGGAPGSLTVSPTHFVTRLTSGNVQEGSRAASVHECKSYTHSTYSMCGCRATIPGWCCAWTQHKALQNRPMCNVQRIIDVPVIGCT